MRWTGLAWFANGRKLLGVAALALIAIGQQSAHADQIVGLTVQNSLVLFDSAAPGFIQSTVGVSGLGGETLLGIDYRPATGQLFGVGSGSNIYQINVSTGVATLVSALSTPLSGTAFGVDFNPVPDRLRVTSDLDQNLRINVATGAATVDSALAYAAGDPNAGANPNIVGSAYTNSFRPSPRTPPPGTTLYDIDSNLDILVIQNPPNNGTLNTVGALGFDTSDLVGFDIDSRGGTNRAFASLTANGAGTSGLYSIDLTTGAATLIGSIGGGVALRGLAVTPVPEPASVLLLATGLAGLAGRAAIRRRKLAA